MSKSTTIALRDALDTQRLGEFFGKTLPEGSVLLLQGDLGAGKTTFVRGVAAGLGIATNIVSPTFTLINEYHCGRLPLYHLDLYRLSRHEVARIYPEIYWEGSEVVPGITAIEWSQRLPYKPDDRLEIHLFGEVDRTAKILSLGNVNFNLNSLNREFNVLDSD